jgi:hypothetical protein
LVALGAAQAAIVVLAMSALCTAPLRSSLVPTALVRIWAEPTLLRGIVIAAYAVPPPTTKTTARVDMTLA